MSLAELFFAKHPRRTSTARSRRRRPHGSKLRFEPLEPRLLLDAQPLILAAPLAADLTLRLVDEAGVATVEVVNNRASAAESAALVRRALADTSVVDIEGSDEGDRLVVDRSVPGELRVNFAGGRGSDKLVGREAHGVWRITALDAGAVDSITFSDVENLSGGAESDMFVVDAGGGLSGLLEGGAGDDTLVGADTENTWTISGADSGILNDLRFADVENLTGGAAADTFVFAPEGSLEGVIDGGAGADTVQGADMPNTWRITATDAGTLNGQRFVSIENLVGGADTDVFVFDGGRVSGTVDGGAGQNVFDYSEAAGDVTVDLAAGEATGTGGVTNLSSVVGGAGIDTLVGADADNVWTITGVDAGTVGAVHFSAFENVTGGELADTFVLTLEGDITGTVSGGLGDDTLVGGDGANTWNITEADGGTVNGVTFAETENLLGGIVQDAFVFGMVGRVSGIIDGRAGLDRARGADKRNRWKLGGSGGTSPDDIDLRDIEQVDGGSGEDELVGPDVDATWTVTGTGSGTVNGVSFSGMEKLTGGADNEDTFVIGAGGSVTLLEGGDRGFDSIVVAEGDYAEKIYSATGPSSGSISLDGTVIQYTGFEPLADQDGGGNVLYETGSGDDVVELRLVAGNQFILDSVNDTFEDATFTDPGAGGTVTIRLQGGADTLTLKNLDTLAATLSIEGGAGDDTFKLDDAWGDVGIVEAAGGGQDTLDFDLFSGTITITPALSGAVTIDGADGSSLTLSAGSADNFEDLDNANIDLAGLTGSVEDELVEGLEALATFARNVAEVGQFATALPLLGKNADVAVAKALGFAEALDELRLKVEEFFAGATLTTDQLTSYLNGLFSSATQSLTHLGAAVFAPLTTPTIAAADVYEFELTIDATTVKVVVDVDAEDAPNTPKAPTVGPAGTVTVGLGTNPAAYTVANLVNAINLALNELDVTSGAILAAQRAGRLAFQVVSTEIDQFAVEGLQSAITKLGFESGVQAVLANVQEVLNDLGDLQLSVGSPVDLAVVFANGMPQLRFDVDYRASRTSQFFYDLGEEAQSLGLSFDLQAKISAAASLAFDFQLGLDLTDSDVQFFLDVDQLRAGLSATVAAGTSVDLNVGFIGATANTTLSLSAGVAATLADTQHILVSQLLLDPQASGGLLDGAPAFTLTDADGAPGSPSFSASLGLTVDAGLGAFAATATLSASGNPFDGSDIDISVSGNFDQFFDFNRMNAAGVVSLLGQVSSWLDGVRQGELIDSLNIPFVEGALDKILDLAEVFSDALLFDEGPDDVRDGANKLATDLNAALADAGLDDLIRAQGDGSVISFIATDPLVSTFTVSVGPGDDPSGTAGFEALGIPTGTSSSLVDGLIQITGSSGPFQGKLGGKAVIHFSVTRDGVTTSEDVTVEAAATADNVGIGDDAPKLLDADNAPTFSNAQGFADRLTQIITLGLVHYDVAAKILTLRLSFTDVPLFDVELPTDFELDLGPIASVQSDTRLIIKATGGLDLTIGLDLNETPAAGSGALANGTTLADDDNDKITIDVKDEEAITAGAAPVASVGQLSGDATFAVTFNPTVTVTVPQFAGVAETDIDVTDSGVSVGTNAEIAMAVNPTNPDNIIVAPIVDESPPDDKVFVSFDGGKSWAPFTIPNANGTGHGDPTIVFDRTGRAVYAHLVDAAADGQSHLEAAVSTDGGVSWTATAITVAQDGRNDDKEMLAVGPDVNDRSTDRFVVAWVEDSVVYVSTSPSISGGISAITNDNPVVITTPTPHGLETFQSIRIQDVEGMAELNDRVFTVIVLSDTTFALALEDGTNHGTYLSGGTWSTAGVDWSRPVRVGAEPVGAEGDSINPIPAVGPGGEIYVAWEDTPVAGQSLIRFAMSEDGGLTFGRDRTILFAGPVNGVPSSTLTDDAKATLDAFAAFLIANPTLNVEVRGHTDSDGSDALNLDLAEDRAQAAIDYLVTEHNIDASRLRAVAYGEVAPVADNTVDSLKALNRRVDLVVDTTTVLFTPTGSFALTETATTILDQYAVYLESNPEVKVEVVGHTDSDGSDSSNITLSYQRANAVRNYLINDKGIDASRLRLAWHGEDQPIASNDTAAGKAFNRRVELKVDNAIYIGNVNYGEDFGLIAGATQTSPVVIETSAPHGLASGARVSIQDVVGMPALNESIYTVTVVDGTHFSLNGENGTGYPAYITGGTWLAEGTITNVTPTNVTATNPVVITTQNPHGLTTGQVVNIDDIAGMPQLNGANFMVNVLSPTTFSLADVLEGAVLPAYTAGGIWEIVQDYSIPAQPIRGIIMGLTMEVDQRDGADGGNIYIAFADQADLDGDNDLGLRGNPTTVAEDDHDDLEIFVLRSSDGGGTWNSSAPVKVNDDVGVASQFHPILDVDQSTGHVAIAWYDARNDDGASGNLVANDEIQYFASFSTDGGVNWADNIQVSDGTSDAQRADRRFNFGEYNGLSFVNGTIHMSWADNSTRGQIDAATDDDPVEITTSAPHGLRTGQQVRIDGVVGMTELNGRRFTITSTGESSFTLDGEDGTGHTAYVSGGTWVLLGSDVFYDRIRLTNESIADLLSDVNAALADAGIGDKFEARPGSDLVRIVAIDPAITEFTVTVASNADPAFRDLGFQLSSESVDEGGDPVVRGAKNVPTTVGQLTADASFDIDLGSGNQTVTVLREDTVSAFAPNRNLLDLISDVQRAIDDVLGDDVIDVASAGGRLLFTRVDGNPDTSFTITPGTNAGELGLTSALTSDAADLIITTRSGATHRVYLDDFATIGDLIGTTGAIYTQTNGDVTLTLSVDDPNGDPTPVNEANTGLTVTDNTVPLAGKEFTVTAANGSLAGLQLGILGKDKNPNDPDDTPDGKIVGATIAGGTLLDRFFITSDDLSKVITADLTVEAGLVIEDIEVVSTTSPDTTVITSSSFEFKESYETDNLRIVIKDIAGFNPGEYEIDAVDESTNQATISKVVGDGLAGQQGQTGGVGTLKTGVRASANVGMVGIELGGTANLGAELSLGFNTGGTSPAADNKLTLQELIDGLDDIFNLLAVPDLTPIAPAANFGTLTLDDVTISLGSSDFNAMDLLGANAAVGITLVTIGDPFIDTRFVQAGYTKIDATHFKVDGDFTTKLPNDVILTFTVQNVSHDLKVVSTSYDSVADKTTVTVALADPAAPPFPLPASLTSPSVDVTLQPKVTVTTPDFGDLLDFSDFSFADIIAALKALAGFLGQFEAFDFLSTDLPIINKSINDLLAFADDFAQAVEEAQNNPAGTLQVLENKLNEAMGLSSAGLNDIFAAVGLPPVPSLTNDVVDLGFDPVNDLLTLDFSLGTSFSQGLDVAIPGIDFGAALASLGLGNLVDLSGSAGLTASGGVLLRLSLAVDVANFDISDPGAHLFVLDTTGLDAKLTVGGEDLAFRVGVGPFALSIAGTDQDPSAITIGGTASLDFKDSVFDADGKVSFNTLFGNLSLSQVDFTVAGTVTGTLPVYFPNDSTRLGAIRIGGSNAGGTFTPTGNLANLLLSSPLVIKSSDGQALGANKIVIDVSDVVEGISSFDFADLNIFDNIFLAIDGLDLALGFIQDVIGSKFASLTIPLIGDDLAKGAHFIGDLREDVIAPLRAAIEKAKDAAQDFADADKNLISKLLFELLGPDGLDLLQPLDGSYSAADDDSPADFIALNTNLDDYLFHPELNIPQSEVFIEWDFDLGDHLSEGADIGFDLGIPGLGLKTEGDIVFSLDWLLQFGFGLSFKDGFYLKVNGPTPELLFDVGVTLGPGTSITGTLGFLGLRAKDKTLNIDGQNRHTELGAIFALDVFEKNPTDAADRARLGFTEFGQIGLNPGVAAGASAALGLELGLSADLFVELFGAGAADVISGFPKVVGSFAFLWEIGSRGNGTTLEQRFLNSTFAVLDASANTADGGLFTGPSIGNAVADGLKLVEFRDISLDLGSFLSDVLGPIVEEVGKFTGPIQPLIDFIMSPVPIIGQLGLDITWLDLAETIAGDAINIGLIRAVAEIITLINDIADLSSSGVVLLPIGHMKVFDNDGDDSNGPAFTDLQLWNGGMNLDEAFDTIKDNATNLLKDLIGDAGGISEALGDLAGQAADTLKGVVDKESAGGFAFPFLEDPTQIFGLLMGKPVDLVTYDLAPLEFEFEFRAFFSILGPLGVSIGLLVEFMVDTAFGYDTQGIQDFVSTGFKNPLLLFNGFFISDSPKLDGSDDPELTFFSELQAAAELNLGMARAGVAAALGFEILFDLFDPNEDGKLRITELIGNIVNQLNAPSDAEKLLAPLAIFDVSGEIFARFFAFLEIDFGFFTFEKEFPIYGPVTLLSFDVDFFRPPVLASEQANGDLILHTGEFADQRLLGNATDVSEWLVIQSDGTDGNFVNVQIKAGDGALGEDSQVFQDYQVKKGRRIIIDGGEGDDFFDLSGFVEDGILFDIELGVGNDKVLGNDAAGGVAGEFSTYRGGSGDDTIGGSGGSDMIFGEAGNDSVTAGAGDDLVFGDEGEIGTDTARGLVRPSDGRDYIDAGSGEDIVFGSGGKDDIIGGSDSGGNLLIGGGGLVTFGSPKVFDNVVSVANGGVSETQNLVSDPTAGDVITGSSGPDIIFGTAGPDVIEAGDGADLVFGQAGLDDIDAGGGNDTVFGDGGQITADGPVPTSGGDPDTIQGGAGDDVIFGGAGADFIQGGDDADEIFGGSGADIIFGDNGEFVDVNGEDVPTPSPYVLVNGAPVVTAPGAGDGNDDIFGEGEPDKIWGGGGNDLIDGGAGPDVVLGGFGVDLMIANKGSDFLDGEQGSDNYQLVFQGGAGSSLMQVVDTGDSGDVDIFSATGTVFDDDILLRANAAGTIAFVAMINDPTHVERINYIFVERIVINGSFGDDYIASDDTTAEVTINGDFGDDTFQIGQMFKSDRGDLTDVNPVDDFSDVTGISVDDVFATIETTRGFLSNGISRPMTINGGVGNDVFTVFHNKAVLQLNGEEGDDVFEIRAFALAGSQEPQRERTDISGGAGADLVQYAVNAPVNIDGGDGFDTVVIIGTEFGDDFVVTDKGVFGAGLNVNFVNIESLRVDGAEGDDRFFVLSTSEKFLTEIFGGLGADTFNMSGATPPVVSNDLRGHSGVVAHEVESTDARFDEQQVFGISANVADNDEPFAVIHTTGGSTIITEGSTTLIDSYSLVLTRAPEVGKDVYIKALAPIPTPSSRERRALSFRLESATATSDVDPALDGSYVVLKFTAANWFVPQTVEVLADSLELTDPGHFYTRPELGDDANAAVDGIQFDMDDAAYEGVRFGVINHLVQVASDILKGTLSAVNNAAQAPTVGITDDGSVTASELFGRQLIISGGKGAGQVRFILGAVDNGATFTLTLDRPFLANDVPNTSTSRYTINIDDAIVGTMTSFVEDAFVASDPDDHRSTFTDSAASFPTAGEGLTGAVVEIIGGPGVGQQRLILGNDPGNPTHRLILNGPWRVNPVANQSIYRIVRYEGLAIPSVTVQINDDDLAGLVVDETKGFADDGDNTPSPDTDDVVPESNTITAVIEGGDGDFQGEWDVIQVRLSHDPGGNVEVALLYDEAQLELTDLGGAVIDDLNHLLFDNTNWDDFQAVRVRALTDGIREGFHSRLIQFDVIGSADIPAVPQTDTFETLDEDEAVYFVGLTQVPVEGSVVVNLNGATLTAGEDFFVVSNKVVFIDGTPEDLLQVFGTISVSYSYVIRGFDTAFTTPILARISDSDAPTLLVRETEGSTDVIEFFVNTSLQPWADSYELVLTGAPDHPVTITVTPEITKTTRTGGIRHDAVQVAISSADSRAVQVGANLVITFDAANWDDPVAITVKAINDGVVDGSDTQVFAPHPNVVSGILGPVVVEGAGGRGSLAINAPLMLPGELNQRKADGNVVAFSPNFSAEPGAIEEMVVDTADLEQKVTDDPAIDSLDDLLGLTVEMATGPGVGVVLDPTRPRELFDRFWQIVGVEIDFEPGHTRLTLKNPSQLNVAALADDVPSSTPDATSEYAITTLSANFFVDEKTQVDFMFVHDEDSPADHSGVLTPNRLYGMNMGPDLVIGGAVRSGGITYNDLEVLEVNLGTGNNDFTVLGTHTRPDGYQTWTFVNAGDDIVWNGVQGDTVTVRLNDEDEVVATGVATTGSNPDGITLFTTTLTIPGTFEDGALEGYLIRILEDGIGANDHEADGQERRIIGNVGGVLTLDRAWEFIPDGEAFEIVNEADGAFAVNLQGGNDTLDASGSSLGIVAFGGLGDDTMTGGSGDDIMFGDRGRVDYENEIGAIVTRLGEAPEPITGFVTTQVTLATLSTIEDSGASFPVPDDLHADGLGTDDIGLRGLYVDINDGFGFLQPIRLIEDNDADTLTLADAFDADLDLPGPVPGDESTYRISTIPEDQTDGVVRDPFLLITVDSALGDDDTIDAGGGNDQIFGGAGGDDIMGGGADDVVIGDAGRIERSRDDNAPATPGFGDFVGSVFETLNLIDFTEGGADTLQGGADDDLLIGGAFGDSIDGDTGNDLIFGDTVQLEWRLQDISDPRFRTLTGTQIYTTSADNLAGADQVGGPARDYRNPDGTPVPSWTHWLIKDLYHTATLEAAADDSFGNDYIAGGTHHDVIFGQLGDDTIQGDGAIEGKLLGNPVLAQREADGSLTLVASFEDANDGDDYIEGNGGSDVVFGGLGQDDLIGGSSDLFTLDQYTERPDGVDRIFGGAGTHGGRNDLGQLDNQLHARDSDTILGDNGDIFRLVGINGTETGFLSFNYDDESLSAPFEDRGTLRIIVRAARLLDYTPGGPDFTSAVESAPADLAINPTTTLRDIGAADEVHGEGGDDFIYTGAGNDVIFGDGQDDNIVAGYGHDWISGGAGEDGILGDDGRLFASRNSTDYGEPLYGITAIAATEINRLIETNNTVQRAILNPAGLLKYTADLTPYNLDPNHTALPNTNTPRPLFANDIIYGGLGNDAIHAGAGEDAISGAEALQVAYTNVYDTAGTKLNVAPVQSDYLHPYNPGNVLGYIPTGPNATKFALYDNTDGMRKILLTNTGALSKTGSGLEWLLNFDDTEGLPDAKWVVGTTYPAQPTDGDDHIFGDMGHDWIVGGTGRDTEWGGWGDDLHNMDDVLGTNNTRNDRPDTNPSWEDLAYGGAGRDTLILNTNGDRANDWTGEFNSYWTPFNAFGSVAVNRLLQPDLHDYFLAVSKSQGADPTLAGQYPAAPGHNGEPFGEIGMVDMHDAAWNDQTGPPRDPQAGNSKGKADVQKTAGVTPLYEEAALGAGSGSAQLLSESELAPIVEAATEFWRNALGAHDPRLGALANVTVQLGNLQPEMLGVTLGHDIYIDTDAAGYGWFIDASGQATVAAGQMDLLSVVMHELGHVLGLDHDGGVMDATLGVGVRELDDHEPALESTSTAVADSAARRLSPDLGRAGTASLIDWGGDVNPLLAVNPYGNGKAAFRPLFPGFEDLDLSAPGRRTAPRRNGTDAAAEDGSQVATLLPSTSWDWSIEGEVGSNAADTV